jgi:DNA-binding MurR/RpiR family transcriptional regulator
MEKPPTTDQLRTEVQRAIQQKSAREVARELDTSPTAILKFARTPGATLYAKTYRKMLPWYERRLAGGLTAPDADDVRPAVNILTRGMTAAEEKRVRKEIARMVARAFDGRQGVQEAVDAALGDE